jgi:hypothetical protein
MNRRRSASMALAVALVLVAAGAVAVWQATHGGCSADRLPDRIGVYTRTDTELTSVDPMPEQSGVRPSLPRRSWNSLATEPAPCCPAARCGSG